MDSRARLRSWGLFVSSASTTLVPVLSVAAFVVAIWISPQRRLLPFPRATFALILAVLVSIGARLGGSSVDTLELATSFGLVLSIAALPVWSARTHGGDALPIFSGIAASAVLQAGLAIFQVLALSDARASGSLGHPNLLGAYAALATVALLGRFTITSDAGKERYWVSIGAAAALTALALSGSRGALAAASTGLLAILWFWVRARGPRPWVHGGIFVAVAMVVAVVLFGALGDRRSDLQHPADASGRLTLWAVAIEGVGRAPILGSGGAAWERIAPSIEPSILPFRIRHPHSSYLQIALERGTLGLAAFLVWIASVIGALWRQRDSGLAAVSLAVLAVFIVNNGAETLIEHSGLVILYWLTIGLGIPKPPDACPSEHGRVGRPGPPA